MVIFHGYVNVYQRVPDTSSKSYHPMSVRSAQDTDEARRETPLATSDGSHVKMGFISPAKL